MSTHVTSDMNQLLAELQASRRSCGVILAACRQLGRKSLEALKRDMGLESQGLSAHYAYDESDQILGVFLEDQKLSATHYYALMLKDVLLERSLLAGSLLVAPMSAGSTAAGDALQRMKQELKGLEGFAEVRFYDHRVLDSEETARILLVNHDQTVTEFLSIYLQRKGYQVTVASDGMTGVQKYREIAPDLVITDLNLPVINGYQLIQHIQEEMSEQKSKIVVLTDKRLEEDVQKSFALGASDYITKPFSPVELAARVKRLIS